MSKTGRGQREEGEDIYIGKEVSQVRHIRAGNHTGWEGGRRWSEVT